jgi:hypothetical protein
VSADLMQPYNSCIIFNKFWSLAYITLFRQQVDAGMDTGPGKRISTMVILVKNQII